MSTDQSLFEKQPSESPEGGAAPSASARGSGGAKAIAGGYTGLSWLVLLLFFLPWVNLSCQNVNVLSQSGFQVMIGQSTENKNYQQELQAKLTKGAGGLPAGLNPNPGLGKGAGAPKEDMQMKKMQDELSSFKALALFPAGLLLTGLFGAVFLIRGRAGKPIVALIGAIMATVSVVICFTAKFPIEAGIAGNTPNAKMMSRMFQVERTGVFAISVGLTLLILAMVVAHTILAQAKSKQSRSLSG